MFLGITCITKPKLCHIGNKALLISEIPEHIADLWLKSIARGIMHVLCEEVLRIHELTPHGTKQLVTDIGKLYRL